MMRLPFMGRGASPHRGHRDKPTGNLQYVIEHRLEGPVFAIVAAMMVIRAAQQFSGGALVMSRFLGPVWFPRFEIITGLGLGLGSEMLMTIAGRGWRAWKLDEAELAARPGLSKIQRASYVSHAQAQATYSFRFMLVGAGASLYTGVAFMLSNATASFGVALADVVTVAIISATVLYLGVFRDSRGQDSTQAALEHIDAGMSEALDAAIARFRDGTYTEIDTQLIAENLPPHKQARFRRAVAKQETGRMWRTVQLREALGIGRDSLGIRDLNRQVNALAKTPENGLSKGVDGRTWLIPHRVVMDVWGEAIMLHRVLSSPNSAEELLSRGKAGRGARQGDGESVRAETGNTSGVLSSSPSDRRSGASHAPVTSDTTQLGTAAPHPHIAGALAMAEPFR